MRSDLAKVLVERPRRGGFDGREGRNPPYMKHKKRLLDDYDNFPSYSKRGMRQDHVERKSLNENLQPLKRMLRSWVGRSWDTFYSELSKVFDKRNTVNAHIFQHLMQYVLVTPGYIDGKYYEADSRWYRRGNVYYGKPMWIPIDKGYHEFYVDRFHILRRAKRNRRLRRVDIEQRQKDKHTVGSRHFEKHDGIWFEILQVTEEKQLDRLRRADIGHFGPFYQRRSLPARELKALGLVNENIVKEMA